MCPILVNTNPPFLALVCSILRKLQGRPYIYLVFDIYPETISVAGLIRKNGLISRMWRSANRVMFKNAAKVIVIGRHMQSILVAGYADHVADKISMIPIWSDDRLLNTDPVKPNPLAKKWEIGGKFVVLYAGNMGRFHDMGTVIEAAKLLQNHEDILFLFVGEGYKKATMQESVKIWRLNNCRFFTYVHRSELRNLYDCADIGLVTLQKGQEGLSVPSKTFGYMAAGLPVVAVISEKSEIALVIQEFECGQVIPPGDKGELANSILQLSQDRVRISSWGQNAKAATIKKFNLAAAANAFHRVVENLECACDKQEKVNNK